MSRTRRRRLPPIALLAVLSAIGISDADEGESSAVPSTRLVLSGEGTVSKANWVGGHEVSVRLEVKNPTDAPIEVRGANLLLALDGGWLVPLDPDGIDGSFLRETIAPGGAAVLGGGEPYRPTRHLPSRHAVLAIEAADGPGLLAVPLRLEGAPDPPAFLPRGPLGVGLAGPVEVLPFSDGQRSILLIGQHQAIGAGKVEQVRTEVLVADAAGSLQPVVWEGLGDREDLASLWPFVRRIDVPESFASGLLKIRATARIGGSPVEFESEWRVREARPVALHGPVLGKWQLGNGPGETTLHPHAEEAEQRYGYDFVKMEQGRTWRGDTERNDSYYAWGRSILAAADGTVVDVCDREPDFSGAKAAMAPCYTNRVVIEHADGVCTVYLNIKQHSAKEGVLVGRTVRRGQVIAQVGNSGGGSEPHLQFMAVRFLPDGRAEPVPVTFENAYHDVAGEQRVVGVPLGGRLYHFIDRPNGNGGR